MQRLTRALVCLAIAAAPRLLVSQERGAAALGELVDGLGVSARVLVVAAHPDDEDTRLIAFLARGRHVETAYLSLTRGDGGQNLIGNELGEALGAIRTEELLAARRIDGGRQYFTRAYDFGFSKSAEETLRHWPRDSVLGDAVRVVRAFRPHVVVAIFSGTPADGHGHHQLSGIIAREAYDLAADTARFPARTHGAPWTPAKFYRSTSYRGHQGATLRYNAGEYSPLIGRSWAEVAAESRSQHKSQAFGMLQPKGPVTVSLRREATRVNEGTPAERERSLFDGVDTTWARIAPRGAWCGRPRLDSLAAALAEARQRFDARHPDRIVAPLGRAAALTDALAGGAGACAAVGADARASLAGLRERLDRALAVAAGVAVEAEVPREVVAYGDSVPVRVAVYNRGTRALRASLLGVGEPPGRESAFDRPGLDAWSEIAPDSAARFTVALRAPGGDARPARPLSQPWWLARPRRGDLFAVPVSGDDEATRTAGLTATVRVAVDPGGTPVEVTVPVVYRFADPVKGDVSRPLAVAPAVSVTLDHAVAYARANAPFDRTIQVRLRSAATASRTVAVRLELPAGLAADSAVRTVALPRHGAQATVDFRVRGALAPGRHVLRAVAESEGERFATGYQLVEYDHIRPQRLYRPAETAIEAVDVALPARANVAYVQGVGDNVAPMLAQLGLPVTVLDPAKLADTDLSRFTAVVVGPRAYEASDALVAANPRLLNWVQWGGTLVVQYGQYEMTQPGIMPYPITLGRPAQRVTIEEAPVRALEPRAPVLSTPNRIGEADFAGWVQERSLYMPQTFDPRYRPALELSDPGEPPNRGAVLVAPLGRGTYVYTTLSLFRQLPAGNPGAARLFVNLLSAHAADAAVQ